MNGLYKKASDDIEIYQGQPTIALVGANKKASIRWLLWFKVCDMLLA
jgi:hypothetical protein